MKISIKEKGSVEFYKEIINVSAHYNKLLRKPEMKIVDCFRFWKIYIILCLVLLSALVMELIFLKGNDYFLSVMVLLLLAIALKTRSQYNKYLDTMLKEDPECELTLDEEGIELKKPSMTVRLPWDKIAFARIFKESICFVPKNRPGMIIGVSLRYYEEMKESIQCSVYGAR